MIRLTNAHLHSRVGGRRTLNGQLILSETHLKSANEVDSLVLFCFMGNTPILPVKQKTFRYVCALLCMTFPQELRNSARIFDLICKLYKTAFCFYPMFSALKNISEFSLIFCALPTQHL